MRYQKATIFDTIISAENATHQLVRDKKRTMYTINPGIPALFVMRHSYAVVAGYEVGIKNIGSSVDIVNIRMYARNAPNTFYSKQIRLEANESKAIYFPNMNGIDCIEILSLGSDCLFYNLDLLRVTEPAHIGVLNSPITLMVTPSRNVHRGFTQNGVLLTLPPYQEGEAHISIQRQVNPEDLILLQINSPQSFEITNSNGLQDVGCGILYFAIFGRDFIPPMFSLFLKNATPSTANTELNIRFGTYFASALDRYNHGYSNIPA